MQPIRLFFSALTLKRQGFTIVMTGFLPTLAIIAMFPIVASMIEHFGDDPLASVRVPAMVTSPGYAIALLAPFAGLFLDKFGRRRLLLISTFFYGIVGAAPFFMNDLDAIFTSRLLLGVCEAGILTTVNTIMADYWDDRGRRNWLLLQGLCGPLLQPTVFFLVSLVATIRWNGGFLVYLIAVPLFVANYFYLFETKEKASRTNIEKVRSASDKTPFPYLSLAMVAAFTLLASVIYFVFIVFGSLAWKSVGVTDPMEISKLTAGPGLAVLAGAAIFRFMSRYSNGIQMATFLALLGMGLATIGLATTPLQMQVGVALQQAGAGMCVPALIAWAQSKFSFEHRGRGIGAWTSAFFLGQALSPLVTGYALTMIGSTQGTFLFAGQVAFGAAILGLIVGLRQRRGHEASFG